MKRTFFKRHNVFTRLGLIGLSLVLAAVSFSISVIPVEAAEDNYETVKVGYYISQGFQEGEEGQLHSGYGYEYLQKVASYTGWKYEYVSGDWSQLYDKLKKGEIDLMTGIAYQESRQGEVLYADSEMLEETFYIYKDSDDSSISSSNYDSYKGKRIGLVEDGKMEPFLQEWMLNHSVDAEVVTYSDIQACANAFNNQEIDCFVSADNIVSGYAGISPVELIGRLPYYICTSKYRPDLLGKLNAAMSLINSQDSLFLTELKHKYTADTSISIFLSKQEREWLEANDTITIGYMNKYLPYCGTDSDGNAQGLILDVVADLFDSLPGDYSPAIQYQAYNNQSDMIDALNNHEIDAAFPVSGDFSYAEQSGYQTSSSVIQTAVDLVYVGQYSEETLSKIAVNKNNNLQYEYTANNFPDAEIVFCDGVEECLSAVKNGQAGCTLVEALRGVEYSGGDNELQILPLTETSTFCFGVAYGSNDLLRVLNHGLSMLGDQYGLTHAYKYMGDILSDSIQIKVEHYLHIIIIVFVAILLVFGLIRYRTLHKLSSAREENNQALQEALFKANQASYARRAFLHNMSHDIRTPLNVISGTLEINQKTDDLNLIRENQAKIRKSVDQLLIMTDNILETSRLESGEAINTQEEVDFASVIQDVEKKLNRKLAGTNISLTTHHRGMEEGCPHVYGSNLCIREILSHVLDNAVKYNRADGSINWTDTFEQEDNGMVYVAIISDTGRGISPDYLQHIFEPFSQGFQDSRTSYTGSGLGLAIVKTLLDQMDGSIRIDSQEGKGTSVTITIPARIYDENQTGATGQSPSEALDTTSLEGLRLLLVEDNDLNIEIEKILLEDSGALVTVARDGKEGLEAYLKAGSGAFDVILMDLMMPVMDGYQATEAIRTSGLADAGTLPIFAVTACLAEEAAAEPGAAFFTGFIRKPLNMTELIGAIHDAKL